jgi:hypothetical protein
VKLVDPVLGIGHLLFGGVPEHVLYAPADVGDGLGVVGLVDLLHVDDRRDLLYEGSVTRLGGPQLLLQRLALGPLLCEPLPQQRAVHEGGDEFGDLARQPQLLLPIAPRLGGSEGHRPHRPSTGGERQHRVRPKPQRLQHLAVLGARSDLLDRWLPGRLGTREARRPQRRQLARDRDLRRVPVRGGHANRRGPFRYRVDGAPVGQQRYHGVRDVLERLAIVPART